MALSDALAHLDPQAGQAVRYLTVSDLRAALTSIWNQIVSGMPDTVFQVTNLPPGDSPMIETSTEENLTEVVIGIPQGSPGLSAYQVAQSLGFVGTEAEWLDSLKSTVPGPTGPAGAAVGVLTTKGDTLVRDSGAGVRLPVGADGALYTADSTAATGVAWSFPPSARAGKNLFNAALCETGKGINASFAVETRANSVLSPVLPIPAGAAVLSVSGLGTYTGGWRYMRWTDAGGSLVAGVPGISTYIENTANAKTFVVPPGAANLQFSVVYNKTGAEVIDPALVQVEVGGQTPFEAWTSGVTHLSGMPVQPLGVRSPMWRAGGRNLLDPALVASGVEVYNGTGAPNTRTDSTAVIDLPLPAGVGAITVSGLPVYATSGVASRNVGFFDEAGNLIGALRGIPHASPSATLWVPLNATHVSLSLVQRKTSGEAIDLSAVQIEAGGVATPYSAYSPALAGSDGAAYAAAAPRTRGLRMLCIGDSITETATVSSDGATYAEGARSNWPLFVARRLQLGALWNYAASGARITAAAAVSGRQRGPVQIQQAIDNNRPADIICYALGTNSSDTAGSYATAMGKATLGDLDQTLIYEALRWSLWTLRTAYPDAVCFAWLPPQQATSDMLTHPTRQPTIDMAQRYGFRIVDAATTSGIVQEFEVSGGAGRDLSDGLHPNTQGQGKLADMWAGAILSAFGGQT